MNGAETEEYIGGLETIIKRLGERLRRLRRELREVQAGAKAPVSKLSAWAPVESGFEQDCQCHSCLDKDPDSWHWKAYVRHNTVGNLQFGICDADDEGGPDYSVDFPPGFALCRRQEAEPGYEVIEDGVLKDRRYVELEIDGEYLTLWSPAKGHFVRFALPPGVRLVKIQEEG